MRSYWTRIALGALGVFAIGMLVIHLARGARSSLARKLNSTDPITLPLAFIPFHLDHQKIGTLDKVVVLRNDPRHVSGLDIGIKLDDSATLNRLKGCVLVSDVRLDARDHGHGPNVRHDSFRCVTDTAGLGLVRFGEITIEPGGITGPLLMPADAADEIRKVTIDLKGLGMPAASMDRVADSLRGLADSIQAKADSIRQSVERQIEPVRANVEVRPESIPAPTKVNKTPTPRPPPASPRQPTSP